jgi:hypothetical protein
LYQKSWFFGYKKVQTAITSENYAEKKHTVVANCSKKSVIYFLKAPVDVFMNYKTKKTK